MNLRQIFDLIQKTGILQLIKIKKFHDSTLTYARNFMTSYCLCALFNVGFFDELSKKKTVNLDIFSANRNINDKILTAICDYLFVLRILNKRERNYILGAKGKSLLKFSVGTFDFIYGYAPLFENLDSLLRNDKKYNVDVFRRNKYVAKATAEVSQFIPIPIVKDIIRKRNFKSILDIGCGSAEFLLQICEDSNLTGYGIDISKEAISYAEGLINEKSLNHRVHVKAGDIFDIEQLKSTSENIDVISSMFVLHEFLSRGQDIVIDLLKKIKRSFPNKYLIVCELSRFAPSLLRKHPSSIAEHHLFHALSEQGLLTVEEWRGVFKKAGYSLIEEKRYDFAGQAYFVLT